VLVLDTNILIRAVLGKRVLTLLRQHAGQVEFWAPEAAFAEAREHLPGILTARGIAADAALELLDLISRIVRTVDAETYAQFEEIARARLKHRDEDDWPVLAAALALGCPIWTEDTDFFGCGVATWTTDRIELYLSASGESQGG
jgi:predicted nucleic acid-binding protein